MSELCSENERDSTPTVSEVDDVLHGSEPGASRNSVLIAADSYDHMAKVAHPSYAAPSAANSDHQGTIEQLKDEAASEMREAERTVVDGRDSSLQNDRLKPPQPIFARIDTPTSLSEDELERNRSSAAPSFSSQSADDAQQMTVLMFV